MRTGILNTLMGLGLLLAAFAPNNSVAQDKHECDKHYNNIAIRFNNGQYASAYTHWHYLLNSCKEDSICPCLNEPTWDMVIFTIETLANEETEPRHLRTLVDSLYNAYEQKMALVGENSYDLVGYGLAMVQFDQLSKRDKVIEVLEKAIEMDGDAPDLYALEYYFNTAYNKFAKKDEGADCGWLVDIYFDFSDKITKAEKAEDELAEWNRIQTAMDQLIEPCLQCDQLTPMVAKIIETLPEDCEAAGPIITKYISLLDKKGCQSSEEFKTLAVKAYDCNKTHEAAYNLGVMYVQAGERSKGIKYIKEAVELANAAGDAEASGKYNYILAQESSKAGNVSAAASYARKATNYNVKAWKYVADEIKANTTCGNNSIQRASVYWLASDYMEKAGYGADYYKSKYPTQRALFEETLSIGSSYTVPCFGQTTKVRAKDA